MNNCGSGQHPFLTVPLAEEENDYSYSPLSSPQLTPRPASFEEEMDCFPFPSPALSCSSSSSADSQNYSPLYSPDSSMSSLSSLSSGAQSGHKTQLYCEPPPMLRTSSCRYATFEAGPAAVMMSGNRLGGVGMVRSYSNPIETQEVAQARAYAYAQEASDLRRNQSTPHLLLPKTTDHIPRILSADSLTAANLKFTSASLFQHTSSTASLQLQAEPTSKRTIRPNLGRFCSLPTVFD